MSSLKPYINERCKLLCHYENNDSNYGSDSVLRNLYISLNLIY